MEMHLLITLAVWRLTHLLAKEDGPFDLVWRLRRKAGTGFFGSLLDCFYCVSVWVALPFGLWQGGHWWLRLLLWVAYSGAACLLEQATTKSPVHPDKPHYEEDPFPNT